MTSSGTMSSSVAIARPSSRKRKANTPTSSTSLSHAQLAALQPFFELAADVDTVFEEEDALSPDKRQMGMGRLYRAWKKWRIAVDPDFRAERDRRV